MLEERRREEQLILDGHKLYWHKDRIDAWLNGERIAPITVDLALTRRCNFKCIYCYGQLQANKGKKLTPEIIDRFLEDAADIGVKGISLMSDGESTCHPYVYDTIVYGKKLGLDMAMATNGAILNKDRLEDILPDLTWLRFNISAGEPKRYAEIHGCEEEDFYKTINRIKECVQIKKRNHLDVTIGTQMVFLPNFKDQILPLTKLGKDLGVDYLVLKHCSDDEDSQLGVDYERYFEKSLIKNLEDAEKFSTPNFFVKAKWSKILSHGQRKYTQCYGPPFLIQLSGSGLVAPCGFLFNDKYERFHIGNIAETPFKEIWQSERYWEVMKYLASREFNAHTDCGTLCCHHKINEYLWDLKKGVVQLEDPQREPPLHMNFI